MCRVCGCVQAKCVHGNRKRDLCQLKSTGTRGSSIRGSSCRKIRIGPVHFFRCQFWEASASRKKKFPHPTPPPNSFVQVFWVFPVLYVFPDLPGIFYPCPPSHFSSSWSLKFVGYSITCFYYLRRSLFCMAPLLADVLIGYRFRSTDILLALSKLYQREGETNRQKSQRKGGKKEKREALRTPCNVKRKERERKWWKKITRTLSGGGDCGYLPATKNSYSRVWISYLNNCKITTETVETFWRNAPTQSFHLKQCMSIFHPYWQAELNLELRRNLVKGIFVDRKH